jgi:prepilin-type N-terminal cleavage/methylation domain-containing protein
MNLKRHHQRLLRSRGFTLLEIVIALGLMGMLVGMIFRVARTSVQLSQMVVEGQKVTMERNAFFNLLKQQFENMPGNAIIRLDSNDSRSGDVSRSLFSLTFQNIPMSFDWGEVPITAEAIELATVEQRDGFVDVILKFYDEEILQDSSKRSNDDTEPFAEITLLEDLWMCDCEVVDGNSMEQFTEWDNDNKLPLQVKFYCRFEPTSDIIQQTFWVVPKQNPEVFFRQVMQQNQAQPQANPGQGESGGKVIDFNNQQKPVSPTPSESQSGSLGNRKGGS